MDLQPNTTAQFQIDSISGPDALSQFSDLLDDCFDVPRGGRFFDDFPVWNSELGSPVSIFRVGIFRDKQLVSAAAVRLCELKSIENRTVRVAILGTVVTHLGWRGQGLATSVTSVATQWAKERGAAIVFLWGSEHSLYRRLGFEFCGYQLRVPLGQLKFSPQLEVKIQVGWNNKIFDLLKARPTGLVLLEGDRRWFERHKNVQWFYTGDQQDPQAYVAYERGIDLKKIVHEWGGPHDQVLEMIRKIYEQDSMASLLASPVHLDSFGISVATQEIEPLCLAKVLDPAAVFSSFYPKIPIQAVFERGCWDLNWGLHSFSCIAEQDLAKLFFGAPEKSLQKELSLPFPLWFWGLDAG